MCQLLRSAMGDKQAGRPGPAAPGSHLVWTLMSPSSRPVTCSVSRSDGLFELVVTGSDGVAIIFSSDARLEPLEVRAADWKTALETRGYVARRAGAGDGSR